MFLNYSWYEFGNMKNRQANRKKLEEDLFDTILLLENKKECRAFFEDICTPAEIEAMADRWRVAQLLVQEIPYRVISEKTGVSLATVTRVARFLFNGNSGYKIILERMRAENE